MGTTSTAIRDVGRVRIGYVLAIEGYSRLLTDSKDVNPVLTAWASTGWTQALSGLTVRGTIRQGITPWATTIDAPTLTFEVLPDRDDTFGIAVWRSRPRFSSRLTAPFEPDATGAGTIEVEDTNGAPGAPPENQLFIGGREVEVSVLSSTQFAVAAGQFGKHQPFAADGSNHYSEAVQTPAQANWDAGPAPTIRSTPTWIGKKVALYIHRIVGDVWDTRAQAQLEFAGKIVSLKEDVRTGVTIVGCEDLRGSIRDAVLLKAQWVGRVPSGIRLQTGDTFYAAESDYPSTYTESGPLEVVASGATGDDEINAGYYELDVFLARLNDWISAEAMDAQWHFALESGNGGRRTVIRAVFPTAGDRAIFLFSNSRHALQFLGFVGRGHEGGGGEITSTSDSRIPWRVFGKSDAGTTVLITSPAPPFVTKPFQVDHQVSRDVGLTLELESADGTWVTHSDFLPAILKTEVGSGEDRSLVRIGDRLFLARRASALVLDDVGFALNFAGYSEGDGPSVLMGRTVDDADERMDVFQVVTLAGTFTDIFTRLVASTDGRGINHADYDFFPKAMGCPGIPFSLLGDEWIDSLRALDQRDPHESCMVVVDKPTPLLNLLMPELLLRFAWIIFKDEHYQLVSPPSPSPITPDFVLDDDNKAAPAGQPDMLRSSTEITKEFLCNVITVRYNRAPDGSYRNEIIVRDETSVATYGETKACTVDAVNSYTDGAKTGAMVESLTASLVAHVLPAFGRPMKLVRRTIAPTLYHMAPGATVALSDNDVRDPTSGIRGLSDRGCIALSVSHTFGHEGQDPFGEVELLFVDEDRCFPMAPAVEVDTSFSGTVDGITFTSGYAATAAGGPALKVKAHAYSRSVDAHDVSLLANSDLIRIYEIDPAVTATITAWDRVLAASSAVDAVDDYVRLTADLSAPAYSTTKQYRIVPQLYSAVQDSQQLAAFAADTDGLIENLIEANVFGGDAVWGYTKTQPDDFPYRFEADETHEEGRPVHGGLVFDHVVNLNVLTSYVTAPHMPALYRDTHDSTIVGFRLLQLFPFFVGLTPHKAAERKLVIAPILSISVGAETASLRVTSSRFPPRGGSNPPKFSGAFKQVTFTHTGGTEAVATEQELDVVPADLPDFTWISVEIMTSDSAAVARMRGFARFFLGPVNL